MKSALKHISSFFFGLLLSLIGLIGSLFVIFALLFSFGIIFVNNLPADSSYANQTIDLYFDENKEDILKGVVEIGLQQQMKEIEAAGEITQEQKAQLEARALDCLSGKLEKIEFQGQEIDCKELSNQTSMETIKEGIKANAPAIKGKEIKNSLFLVSGIAYILGFLLIFASSRFRLRKSLYRLFSKSAVFSFIVALFAFCIKSVSALPIGDSLNLPFFITFFAELILLQLKPVAQALFPISVLAFILFLILTIICWKKHN